MLSFPGLSGLPTLLNCLLNSLFVAGLGAIANSVCPVTIEAGQQAPRPRWAPLGLCWWTHRPRSGSGAASHGPRSNSRSRSSSRPRSRSLCRARTGARAFIAPPLLLELKRQLHRHLEHLVQRRVLQKVQLVSQLLLHALLSRDSPHEAADLDP